MTVQEVRDGLLALARDGDAACGGGQASFGDFSVAEEWHAGVVEYVRAAMGDTAADDVALRLRFSRGDSFSERERNAVGHVNDWLGTQALALTADKIVPGFDGAVPVAEVVCEEVAPELEVAVAVAAELEIEDGDTGPRD